MNLTKFPEFLHASTPDHRRSEAINIHIPGWSGPGHYAFFKMVLEFARPQNILVLGVYHGRDLAYIEDAGRQMEGPPPSLVGVDLFSPGPCADWPEDARSKTWQEMGFGPNPDLAGARRNAPTAEIIVGDSVDYLKSCGRVFDFIYFDTSHDENTIQAELDACRACCHENTVLAGDDFNDIPSWRVKRTITKRFEEFRLYPPIWLSTSELLRP